MDVKGGESPIFARAYDLALETCKMVERFPRSKRAVLGRRLEESALQFQAQLAAASQRMPNALSMANLALNEYRFALRLAHGLELISTGYYGEISKITAECGRLLGGWIKKTATPR